MADVLHATPTRADLDQHYEHAAPHLRPILDAVRDCGVAMMIVPQTANPFRLPRTNPRPTVVLIGDDYDTAVGPEGFHMPSVRRAIRACSDFTVVSCEALPHVYASATVPPVVARRHSMLIETRPEQEIAWVSLIQKLAPGRHILLATVEGGHA